MKSKIILSIILFMLIIPVANASLDAPNWRIGDYWEYTGSFDSELENITLEAQFSDLRLAVATTEIAQINGDLTGSFKVDIDGSLEGTVIGEVLNPFTNNTLEVDVGFIIDIEGNLYFTTNNLSLISYDLTANINIDISATLLEFLESNLLEPLGLFIPEQVIEHAIFDPPLNFMDFPINPNEEWDFSSNITSSSEIIGENQREELPPQTSEIYFEAENFERRNDVYLMRLSYIPFLSDIAELMEIDIGNEWHWSNNMGMVNRIAGLQDGEEILVIGLTDDYRYDPNRESNNPPIATFNYNPHNPSQTDQINFEDQSTDPDGDSDIQAWYWDFGDGKNGTGKQVKHQYESSGTYTVNLFVIDKYGGVDTFQQSIEVSGNGDSVPGFEISLILLCIALLTIAKSFKNSR